MAAQDLTGQRFGMLTALSRAPSNRRGTRWLCVCDCGGRTVAIASNLKKGNSKSCGCVRRMKTVDRCAKHGHGVRGKHSAEYRTWRGMLARCRDLEYPGYGADGVTVCQRWEHGEDGLHGFLCFLADMGPRPPKHSIDRIDPYGDYEPDNCRWASLKQQARNRRASSYITVYGQRMTVADAAELFNINYGTLQYRLHDRGMTADLAVSAPIGA